MPVLNFQVREMSGHAVTPKANNLLENSLAAVFSRQKQHFRPPSANKEQEDSEIIFFSKVEVIHRMYFQLKRGVKVYSTTQRIFLFYHKYCIYRPLKIQTLCIHA